MNVGKILAIAGLALSLPGAVLAQDDMVKLGPGLTEFNIAANLQFDPEMQNIILRWAPFVSSNFQWGIDFTATKVPGTETSGTVGVIGNYYFNADQPSQTYFYAGGAAGTQYGVNDDLVWGAQAGVKYFVGPSSAIFAEFQWRTSDDVDSTGIIFGLSYLPSGGVFSGGDMVEMPGPGKIEYNFAGNIGFDPEFQTLMVRVAPFVSETFQWGVDFTATKSPGVDMTGIIGAVGNFYPSGQTSANSRYYIGAAAGTGYGEFDDAYWGAQVGIKWMLRSDVAATGEFQFRSSDNQDTTGIMFGLSFFR